MKYNDALLSPPGPMVDITVRPLGQLQPTATLPAQLDTGADLTLIPPFVADDLQLVPEYSILIAGYDGTEAKRMAYLVDLEIAGYRLESVKVVAAPLDFPVLGRDALNHFIITLNGKTLTFEMQDP
jgi:predicted aspartyl protease